MSSPHADMRYFFHHEPHVAALAGSPVVARAHGRAAERVRQPARPKRRRIESSVTSVSWIPPRAVPGLVGLSFDLGITHYDRTPPDVVGDLAAWRDADRFRFANQLRAWIEVEAGRIVRWGRGGSGVMGATRVRVGRRAVRLPAVAFPDLRPEPDVGAASVRFVQTAGGRPALPAPRRVTGSPFLQVRGPIVWTTLALTLHADGRAEHEVVGASPFPRHWVYDGAGRLVEKTGLLGFDDWYHTAYGTHSPWGGEDRPATIAEAESVLERGLVAEVFGGQQPRTLTLEPGDTLVRQGDPGTKLFVVLDGLLSVDIDGKTIARAGPGKVLGEQAAFRDDRRTATLTALTAGRVAVADPAALDREALRALDRQHAGVR